MNYKGKQHIKAKPRDFGIGGRHTHVLPFMGSKEPAVAINIHLLLIYFAV